VRLVSQQISSKKFLCLPLVLLAVFGGSCLAAMIPFGFWKKTTTASNVWSATSTTSAPSGRVDHTMVWTGSKAIVWGGDSGSGRLNTGGIYDPSTNSWTATSVGTNVPAARSLHVAAWADGSTNKMIVWGGNDGTNTLNTGGVYDPVADTWSAAVGMNTFLPMGRYAHSSVWTGSKLIIWGGDGGVTLNTGAVYDPTTSTWTPTSVTSALSARNTHTAVWTGSKMIIWGGWYSSGLNDGGVYDPSTDTWTAVTTTGAPTGRSGHSAVWADGSINKMIVWGGYSTSYQNTGGLYDPATNTWTATQTTGAPTARDSHTAVWAGTVMIVWGGDGSSTYNTGGRYDPVGNSWTATQTTGVPTARYLHTAVWTGTKMIVWGGRGSSTSYNTGGVYDLAGNSWTATQTRGAPGTRYRHAVAWTGPKMVGWGGHD